MDNHGKQLFTFLFLTFAISSVFYFFIIKSGHLASGGGAYVLCLMWSPALSAMLTCRLFGRDLGTLGWKWGAARYQVMSYFIPLLYAGITYLAVWILHLGGFYEHGFVANISKRFGLGDMPAWAGIALYFFFAATAGMVRSCSSALGEEIGWRGFLVPHLAQRYSFTATALITGIIWSLWHYPVLIFADYNAGTPVWYGLICFTVMIVSSSFIYTWLRLKSGSLWTGVLLHASHNLFIQSFFDPITSDMGKTKYVIGEFGAGLALVSVIFAIYFWTRRNELPRTQESSAVAA
jgi:uncharacterized protein